MSPSPRYLHVIQRYYPFRGGSERYFQAFSERFVADGARVQVVTSDAWDLEYFWNPKRKHISERYGVHNGVEIRRVPVRHLPVATVSHRAIRRLMAESSRATFPTQVALLNAGARFGPWIPGLDSELAALDRPDLVNSANIAFESMIRASERFARRHDVPHVITPFLHLGESADSKVRRYYTMPHQIDLLKRADALMVLTELEADYLRAAGVHPERIRVVGAGIDVAGVVGGDGASVRQRRALRSPMVLSLGAAAFEKGTIHLIEAIRKLHSRGAEVDLVLAGPLMSDVDQFVNSLAPAERERIHVLGFVTDDERRDLLDACDLLALPSRTESFGLVFMEAWANQKPVIGARAGAIPSVVTDGEDGLLIDFGDVGALADAIEALVDSPALAARMGKNGSAKVVSEADWFKRVREVYSSVLGAVTMGAAKGST